MAYSLAEINRFCTQKWRKIMSVVKELIRKEADETLSFGDYTLARKTKKSDFEFNGDLYKVKTFQEITKLEKNGMFVYESIPGTTVNQFAMDGSGVEFSVEGTKDTQITLGLEPEKDFDVSINNLSVGVMRSNLGGKLVISLDLLSSNEANVKVAAL
jgi:hypothetical protein